MTEPAVTASTGLGELPATAPPLVVEGRGSAVVMVTTTPSGRSAAVTSRPLTGRVAMQPPAWFGVDAEVGEETDDGELRIEIDVAGSWTITID